MPLVSLLTSPLHDRHVAAGAKLADFSGWSMPIEYAGGGVLAEHTAVREAVGLFDVSHLGTATVRGPGAAAFVDSCLTNDLSRIGPGQAQYTLCCDESGGVVDDLIVYLHGPDHVLLVPNAANAPEVLRRLTEAAPDGVTVTDRHREIAVLAVQVDDQVVHDAAALVAAQRVLGLTGADPRQVVGQAGVDERRGARSADRRRPQVGDVEQAHCLADGGVLGEHTATGVLDRHRPSAEVGELGAGGDVPVVEGGGQQAHGWHANAPPTIERCRRRSPPPTTRSRS